jgi:pyrroloquinoline quinone biosynthesis protein E
VRQLEDYGFVQQVHNGSAHPLFYVENENGSNPMTVLIAPESVHLQLNNVCNLRCPSCYVRLQPNDEGSLPLERLITLIDEIAALGVFQLALGGGEALLSPHFVGVVQHARQKGLLPHVTTNGWLLTEGLAKQIRDTIGEVRLSYNDGVSVHRNLLVEKASLLRAQGIRFGFNVIVTHHNIERIGDILTWLLSLQPLSITLIRPKPVPHNEQWYQANALSAQDSVLLLEQLRRMESAFAETSLTVDCAFSYLFQDMSEAELLSRGVAGCSMGERFVVIAWNGDVYPCSHLYGKEFVAGNITTQSFRDIWERSNLFVQIQEERNRLDGHCGSCDRRRFCGGCRAILWQTTGNLRAADTGCPLPLTRPKDDEMSPFRYIGEGQGTIWHHPALWEQNINVNFAGK